MQLPAKHTVVQAVGVVVLIALVAPFVVAAVPQVVDADQSYTVTSGSMEPAIGVGDVVVVRDVPAETIETGDVITYELDGPGNQVERRTHRVIEVVDYGTQERFRTKGDANEDPDKEVVPPDAVVGVVVLTLPYVGYVIRFANTPLGLLTLVVVPAGLLFVTEAWSLARAVRRSRRAESSGDASTGDGPETPTSERSQGGDD